MKFAFVDYRTSIEELSSLEKLNIKPIKIPQCKDLYNAIDGHVDIQVFQSSPLVNEFIIYKYMKEDFLSYLISLNINFALSSLPLENKYPKNIALNCISTESILIHNLQHTDSKIKTLSTSKTIINVKQGYSRCSCAIVSNSAFITSDTGIYTALKDNNYDVLLLPTGDILLEGFDYGFIGGTCGLISKNTMAFFGDLNKYKYGAEVKSFLKSHDVNAVYLSPHKLVDRGGLFVFDSFI